MVVVVVVGDHLSAERRKRVEMPPAARELGVVTAWVHNRGFGFIKPHNAKLGRSLFVHRTAVRGNIQGTLRAGATVEFTPVWREAEDEGDGEGGEGGMVAGRGGGGRRYGAGFGGTHCYAENVTGRGGSAPEADDDDAADLTGKMIL